LCRIIATRIAAGDLESPFPEHFGQLMINIQLVTLISNATDNSIDKPSLLSISQAGKAPALPGRMLPV
jgi:hypothetical protein